jgi:cysteine desulfuration protein SufE|tara:strand:+ start:603 stop:995 length:393 start_codon:yes stop_codon:yes gene_type:complete
MSESKLQQYIDNINQLESEEVYDYVLEIGQQAKGMFTDRLDEHFVHGCQSPVWVTGIDEPTGWEFSIDSDSYMVRGVGHIICECLSGLTTDEIKEVTFFDFKDLSVYFSTQRRQGMQSIINKIKSISKGN